MATARSGWPSAKEENTHWSHRTSPILAMAALWTARNEEPEELTEEYGRIQTEKEELMQGFKQIRMMKKEKRTRTGRGQDA